MSQKEQEKFDLDNPGPFIRERREFFKLSQGDLAFLAGVKQNHISEIENENRKPSLEVLNKLLYALNSDIYISNNNELKKDVKKIHQLYKTEMNSINQAKKRLENLRDKHFIEGENQDN